MSKREAGGRLPAIAAISWEHLGAPDLRIHTKDVIVVPWRLGELGFGVDKGESQVIALEAGPENQTVRLRRALEERGVFGAVFCAPATPKNRSLVRLSVHCGITDDQIDHVVDVCREIRDEVGMADWPSTLRNRSRKVDPDLARRETGIRGLALGGLGIRSLLSAVNDEYRSAS